MGDREGIGDGHFYDWSPDDGAVPKIFDRAAKIACKEQQDTGASMIPTHSKLGQGMRIQFEKLLDEHGHNVLIPVCLENDTPNFYLNREVKSEEIHSGISHEQNFEKESQQSGNGYGSRT